MTSNCPAELAVDPSNLKLFQSSFMLSSKRKNLPISKDDISLPLPSQELLVINAVPVHEASALPKSPASSANGHQFAHGSLQRNLVLGGDGSVAGGNPKMTLKAYASYAGALAVYRKQIAAMAAASEAFVRSCEELEAVVSQSASSGTGSVQDEARLKDLNALIDSTRMIANAHQVWAENLGQDVGDPLNRHLGDIMLTVKARQDKNKARIEGLVTKLHDEEDHSYKLSKKKQRDLVMLQESLSLRVTLADEIKRLTVENASIGDRLASNSVDLLLSACSSTVYSQLETYEKILDGLKKVDMFEAGDFQARRQANKEAILKSILPQMTPRQGSLKQTTGSAKASAGLTLDVGRTGSMRATDFPEDFEPPQPPGTDIGLSLRELDPDDSISNIAPQYSPESVAAMQGPSNPPPVPMTRNLSRGVPGPAGGNVRNRMKFFGGGGK